MDVIARLPGCDGQAADPVSAYTQVKSEDAPKFLKIPKSECPDVWIRLPRHEWQKSIIEDPVVPLEEFCYGHISWIVVGKTIRASFIRTWMRSNSELRNVCSFIVNKAYFCQYLLMTLRWLERSRIWLPCGRNWWRTWIMMNQHHFLTMYIRDVLNVNANRMRPLLNSTQKHVISAGATEKLPEWQKTPHALTVAWTYDVEGHAQKCVERYCELANKKVEQGVSRSFSSLFGRSSVQKGGIGISWRIIRSLLTNCQKILVPGTYWKTRHSMVVNKLARAVTNWTQSCDRRLARVDFIHSSQKWPPTMLSCG